MGRQARANQAKREYRKTIPSRVVKTLVGFLLGVPFVVLIFYALARECYQQNSWPWDVVNYRAFK